MNKKGFTLIELLAVIVILGIILAIAIPSVARILEKTKYDAFVRNNEILVNTTKTYLAANADKVPISIGETIEVKLSDLKANNLIDDIKGGNGENCNGYVLVTKVSDKKLQYVPHLNCLKNIGSAEDDGLIVHFTFDDFQEPTENYLAKAGYRDWFVNLKIGDNIDHAVGGGVIRVTRIDEFKYRAEVIENVTYPILELTNNFIWPANTPIIFSANITDYKEGVGSQNRLGIGRSSWGAPTLHGKDSLGLKSYYYLEDVDRNGSIAIRSSNSLITKGTYLEWEFLQAEYNKTYTTPFTESIREAFVKDYSLNNHHAKMELTKTPKWVREGKVGEGAYEFNGDDYIRLTNISELKNLNGIDKPFTISLWAKATTRVNDYDGLINILGKTNNYEGLIVSFNNSSTSMRVRFWQDGGTNITFDAGSIFDDWVNIVVTVANKRVNIYQNGKLVTTGSFTNPFTFSDQILLGLYDWQDNYFSGLIDDFKLYSRELTSDEIRINYEVYTNN